LQDLKLWFEKARLPVKIEKINSNQQLNKIKQNDLIFRMSIRVRGKKKKREYFHIYYGHPDNDIRVIDVDPKLRQLVLLVHEPEREFTVRIWNKEKNKYEIQKRKTSNFFRKYLIGMDERHLFISQVADVGKPINKVKDAHKFLKPQDVRKEEKNTSQPKRQGEWFFVPATKEELNEINLNIKNVFKKAIIEKTNGNPHIADFLIKIKGLGKFVRGKIWHPEHKTLKLHGWFKVYKNQEIKLNYRRTGFVD